MAISRAQAKSDAITAANRTMSPRQLQMRRTLSYKTSMNLFEKILNSEEYRDNFYKRAIYGMLPPGLEQMMFHYLAGKPPESIDLSITDKREDLSGLPPQELADRLVQLQSLVAKLVAPGTQTVSVPAVVVDKKSQEPDD